MSVTASHVPPRKRTSSGRRAVALAGLAAALTIGVLAAGASPATAGDLSFGTDEKAGLAEGGSGPGHQVSIRSVAIGRHGGYDRLVVTTDGGMPAWRVRYLPSITQDGSGAPVPLLGSAFVSVVLTGTNWNDKPSPQPTLTPRFPALRQVKGAGEFEAVLTYGLGQAGKDGFRAFTLTGPDRLVVDLKHPATANTSAGSGTAVPAATEDSHTRAGIPGNASGELAETGPRHAAPTALIGGLLVLGGLLLAAACVQVTRRART